MKVKFQSRFSAVSGIGCTPTSSMTNLFLVLICLGGYMSVCNGQRVVWLYKLPSSRIHYTSPQREASALSDNLINYENSNELKDAINKWNLRKQLVSLSAAQQNGLWPSARNYAYPSVPFFRDSGYYGSVPLFLGGSSKQFWHQFQYQQQPYPYGFEDETVNKNVLVLPVPMPKKVAMQQVEENQIGSDESDEIVDSNKSGSLEMPGYKEELRDYAHPVVAITSVKYTCDSEGMHFRYHAETGSCYTIGTRGPCGDKMIFTASDSANGYCECDQSSFDRPLVRIGNQCYFLYTQATCPQGYWLIPPDMDPVCQQNPCLAATPQYHPFSKKNLSVSKFGESNLVLLNGECVALNKRSSQCKRQNEVVFFPEGSAEPACGIPKSRKRLHRRQISSVPTFRCGPNMIRLRSTGRCVRMIRFRPRG